VLIPQEAYVFAGSVRDNLTYLNAAATDTQLHRAVAAVGAEALVARLGGFAAEVTPAELSAGERQLLALVRAYLSPAPLVVLDEATCHLDPAAERRAEEAFAGRGGTLIVIAHRISSALRARRVLVLDDVGATVGDHDSLQATSSLYRELLGHWQVAPVSTNGWHTAARQRVFVLPGQHRRLQVDQPVLPAGQHHDIAGVGVAEDEAGPVCDVQ
jgi:ATP-binding cassette subfamily C protein